MATRTQVLSLFGATPEQIRQQQALAEAERVQAIRDPYQQTGAVLGAGLARLFAGPSPEETQAMQMQEALQGVDVSDPEALREVARTVSTFAPDRALMILDRASQVEGVARQKEIDEATLRLRKAQNEKAEFDNFVDRQDRAAVVKARDLETDLLSARLSIAQGQIQDADTLRKQQEQAKTKTAEFFAEQENDPLATSFVELSESGAIEPYQLVSAYLDAKSKRQLNIQNFGNYTDTDGNTVLAGVDEKSGKLMQLKDGGWQPVAEQKNWTRGTPSKTTPSKVTPRTMTNSLQQIYNVAYDKILENVEDSNPPLYRAMTEEGILFGRNEMSDEDRIGLYEEADVILKDKDNYPNITTTQGALEQALKIRAGVVDSDQDQQTQGDPFAGATIRSN